MAAKRRLHRLMSAAALRGHNVLLNAYTPFSSCVCVCPFVGLALAAAAKRWTVRGSCCSLTPVPARGYGDGDIAEQVRSCDASRYLAIERVLQGLAPPATQRPPFSFFFF